MDRSSGSCYTSGLEDCCKEPVASGLDSLGGMLLQAGGRLPSLGLSDPGNGIVCLLAQYCPNENPPRVMPEPALCWILPKWRKRRVDGPERCQRLRPRGGAEHPG